MTSPPSSPHHLAIQTRDLAASEQFYSGLLGLKVFQRWPWPDGRPGERAVWLQLGEMFLAGGPDENMHECKLVHWKVEVPRSRRDTPPLRSRLLLADVLGNP